MEPRNPFELMMNPTAVIEAMERSRLLAQLHSRVYRLDHRRGIHHELERVARLIHRASPVDAINVGAASGNGQSDPRQARCRKRADRQA